MGSDKASILVGQDSIALRTARNLSNAVESVTILGRRALEGYGFLKDSEENGGPLRALSHFHPSAELVFVVACDYPKFDSSVVDACRDKIERHPSIHAVVPIVAEREQPLCAIYRRGAFSLIPTVLAESRCSMHSWLDSLWVEWFDETELLALGVPAFALASFNSPEELQRILMD